ncbi:hypothetical protein ES708_32419 [subsurface metagenome]
MSYKIGIYTFFVDYNVKGYCWCNNTILQVILYCISYKKGIYTIFIVNKVVKPPPYGFPVYVGELPFASLFILSAVVNS